ncbi:MAG: outer membrane lipoprotein-sorting protein [Spirochaetes bacterium]|nr:outer membrane lipoprotein-sorting protein [Spirochaetota bacterium]
MSSIRRIAIELAAVAAFIAAPLSAETPDFTALLKAVDANADFGTQDYSAVFTIVTQKPDEKDSVMQIRLFRRDEHDQVVWIILKPESQKGQGLLKVDENIWMYDPESGKFSHSTMKEQIQNSKAKSSDLTRASFAEDYDIASWEEGTLGKYPVWVLTLKAKNNEVSYPTVKVSIRKDKPLVMKEEDYSVSDRLMRTVLFPPKYIELAGKTVYSQILIQDDLNKGEKSQLTISDVSVAKLPDATFTKAFLGQSSR